jgi:hypothetical protein
MKNLETLPTRRCGGSSTGWYGSNIYASKSGLKKNFDAFALFLKLLLDFLIILRLYCKKLL